MKQQIDWNSANIEEVVKGIGNKDTEAYEEFFNRTVNKAYIIAHRVLGEKGNSADAEDMVQDAYMTAFNNIKLLNNPEKAISWFGTIVGNKCKDYLRKNKVILFEEIDTDDVLFEETIENEYQDFIPEEAVDYSETKRLMDEIVDNLPKDQKLCTLLFYYNDLSVKEIAEALDCSEGTVKSRLNYSRKKIEDEVKALEKRGTKLYSIAPMPFISWMLKDTETTLVVPEVIKTQILAGANAGASVATSIAAKTSITKAVSAGVSAAGKTLATKIIAGVVAASLVVGGGVFVARTVVGPSTEDSMTTEESEDEIMRQLDYNYLEQIFYYLPLYDSENPVTDEEMEQVITQSMIYQYTNITANLEGEDKCPTFFNNDDYIEIVDEANYEETKLYSYMRVEGTQFDEFARIVSFKKEINEEFINNLTDPQYDPILVWDNDNILISTMGLGGLSPDWDVVMGETVEKDDCVEVNYRLDMTVSPEWNNWEEYTYVSYRTAYIELKDGKYVIVKITESDESDGAVSIAEDYFDLML